MDCPICIMRTEIDDLRAHHEAARVELKMCWVEGGLLNLKPTPTTIRIDVPISPDHRLDLLHLLKKIEYSAAKEASE